MTNNACCICTRLRRTPDNILCSEHDAEWWYGAKDVDFATWVDVSRLRDFYKTRKAILKAIENADR